MAQVTYPLYSFVFGGPGWAVRSYYTWEWYDATGQRLAIVDERRGVKRLGLTNAGERCMNAREAALMCLAPPRGKTLAELW